KKHDDELAAIRLRLAPSCRPAPGERRECDIAFGERRAAEYLLVPQGREIVIKLARYDSRALERSTGVRPSDHEVPIVQGDEVGIVLSPERLVVGASH